MTSKSRSSNVSQNTSKKAPVLKNNPQVLEDNPQVLEDILPLTNASPKRSRSRSSSKGQGSRRLSSTSKGQGSRRSSSTSKGQGSRSRSSSTSKGQGSRRTSFISVGLNKSRKQSTRRKSAKKKSLKDRTPRTIAISEKEKKEYIDSNYNTLINSLVEMYPEPDNNYDSDDEENRGKVKKTRIPAIAGSKAGKKDMQEKSRKRDNFVKQVNGVFKEYENKRKELKKFRNDFRYLMNNLDSNHSTDLTLKSNLSFNQLVEALNTIDSVISGNGEEYSYFEGYYEDIKSIKKFILNKESHINELSNTETLNTSFQNIKQQDLDLVKTNKEEYKRKLNEIPRFESDIERYKKEIDVFIKKLKEDTSNETYNSIVAKIKNFKETGKLKGESEENFRKTNKINVKISSLEESYSRGLIDFGKLSSDNKSESQLGKLKEDKSTINSELNGFITSIGKLIKEAKTNYDSSLSIKNTYDNNDELDKESETYKDSEKVIEMYESFFKVLTVEDNFNIDFENVDSYIESAKKVVEKIKKDIEEAIERRETELAAQKGIKEDLGTVKSNLKDINSKEGEFNTEYKEYTAKLKELNNIKETQMKNANTKEKVEALQTRTKELSREINASIIELNGFVEAAKSSNDSAQGIKDGIDNKASGLKEKKPKDIEEIKSNAGKVNTVFKRINRKEIKSEEDISKIVSSINSTAESKIGQFDEAERKKKAAEEKAAEEKARKEAARKEREAAAEAEKDRKRREREDKERLRTLPRLIPTLKKNIGVIIERYRNNLINNKKVKAIVKDNMSDYENFVKFPEGKSNYDVSELREIERIAKKVENDYENVIGIGRIFVKFFPIGPKENPKTKFITSKNNDITIHSENCDKFPTPERERGPFTKVFTTKNNNKDVFNEISSVIKGMKPNDYNFAFMALGQSGSGKTFTITGGKDKDGNKVDGVLQEAIEEVKKTKPKKIFISSIQIYKGKVYDALVDKESSFLNKKDINVIKSVQDENGIYQVDAETKFDYIESQKQISGIDIDSAMTSEDVNDVFKRIKRNIIYEEGSNKHDLDDYIKKIQGNRPTRQTLLNDESSRSHLYMIFTIEYPGNEERILSFIDLAGNEVPYKMPDKSEAKKEGVSITHGIETLNIILQKYSNSEPVPKDKWYESTGSGIGQSARGTIKDFSSWNVLNGIIGFFKEKQEQQEQESFSKLILLLTLHPTVPDTSLIGKKKLTELTQKELKAIELKNQICGTTRRTLLFGEQVLGIKRTQGGTSKLKAKKISLKRNSKSSIKKKSPKKKKVSQKRKTPKKKVIKKKL